MQQQTNYPWDGDIVLRFGKNKAKRFNLHVRIPGWVQGHPVPSALYRYTDSQQPAWSITVNGQRAGHWIYYSPDGTPQSEATFAGGREEGPYKVFRENGVPYYIGQYHEGIRTGTWEIYEADGTLATTQDY